MPGSNQNSNYQWVPTTAKDNLCGFASFVPLIDSIIERPRDFYGAECNNAFSNRFIDLYAAELPQSQTRYDNDADAKADAVKNAFARIMQETPNHVGADTPFKLLMQMVCAEYIRSSIDTDDESEPELQDNMVHKLLAAHATQLREAYAAFAANVEQEVAMDANVAHEDKFAVKSAACVDGNFFTRFIAQFKPELLAELKQVYCAEIREPRNAYAARATDMIYIAKMLGCISVLTIQNIPIHDESQQSAANEPTVSEFALNPTGTIEMVVKNVGYHWQPASLDTNAEPQDEATIMPALEPINSTSTDMVSISEDINNHLLFIFGQEWRSQATILNKVNERDSEIARILQQADTFIANTKQVNALLENNNDPAQVNSLLVSLCRP